MLINKFSNYNDYIDYDDYGVYKGLSDVNGVYNLIFLIEDQNRTRYIKANYRIGKNDVDKFKSLITVLRPKFKKILLYKNSNYEDCELDWDTTSIPYSFTINGFFEMLEHKTTCYEDVDRSKMCDFTGFMCYVNCMSHKVSFYKMDEGVAGTIYGIYQYNIVDSKAVETIIKEDNCMVVNKGLQGNNYVNIKMGLQGNYNSIDKLEGKCLGVRQQENNSKLNNSNLYFRLYYIDNDQERYVNYYYCMKNYNIQSDQKFKIIISDIKSTIVRPMVLDSNRYGSCICKNKSIFAKYFIESKIFPEGLEVGIDETYSSVPYPDYNGYICCIDGKNNVVTYKKYKNGEVEKVFVIDDYSCSVKNCNSVDVITKEIHCVIDDSGVPIVKEFYINNLGNSVCSHNKDSVEVNNTTYDKAEMECFVNNEMGRDYEKGYMDCVDVAGELVFEMFKHFLGKTPNLMKDEFKEKLIDRLKERNNN